MTRNDIRIGCEYERVWRNPVNNEQLRRKVVAWAFSGGKVLVLNGDNIGHWVDPEELRDA